MKRYPDKFTIVHYRLVQYGSENIYEKDPDREDFIFDGRITRSNKQFDGTIQGDMSRATHEINCAVTEYEFVIGQKITDQNGKQYELLIPDVGQKASKLWVAYI